MLFEQLSGRKRQPNMVNELFLGGLMSYGK